MWKKLVQIAKLPDVRNSILFVLGMLVIFRVAANVPVPGVDLVNLTKFFHNQNSDKFSVVAMGVGPYITASIILQLLTMIIPRFEKLSKDGEYGRQKINQYTRYLTIPIAALQGYALISLLQHSPSPIITATDPLHIGLIILVMTAGTALLMWLGELISEKNIGNGISLLIFAGIVSRLPSVLDTLKTMDSSEMFNFFVFVVIGLITIASIVYMTEGQRNIPVTYARQVRGSHTTSNVNTHLPLRVNQAGVIPIIFAISIVLFPPTIAQFFVNAKTVMIKQFAQGVISFFNDRTWYGVMYFFLVIAFTYFYTSIIFKPDQIAENLQKQGGFVPGIRPGKPTENYLWNISNKIILPGALFLAILAVLPVVMQQLTNIRTLTVGGTSLLIVVSVVLETIKQVDAQLTMRDYEDLV